MSECELHRCKEDTKGQTCYICTQALHWKTKEGLVRMCSCRGTAGFAHVSCLVEQVKILVAEVEENRLGDNAMVPRWERWQTCSLCEQKYHGIVSCALGWACWKTYLGRPETDKARQLAMTLLGNGLFYAKHHEDALSVREAEFSTLRRFGAPVHCILIVQTNLACAYEMLGRREEALRVRREVYSGRVRLNGEEHEQTLVAANNYADSLRFLKRFKEAQSLMRKVMPISRRHLGESNHLTLSLMNNYATSLYEDPSATLDDLSGAVTTLEDIERISRRVLGGAHPLTLLTEEGLRRSRAVLRYREASSGTG